MARRGKDTARTKSDRLAREAHEALIARFRDVLRDVNARSDRDELAKILLDEWQQYGGAFQRAFDTLLDHERVERAKPTVDEANHVLERDYMEDVDNVAQGALRAIKDEEINNAEELHDWLHQTLDGTQRVTYTRQAQLGLVFSRNDDAYVDNYGADGVADADGNVNWSALMYAAMERDVHEALDRLGVDVNDPVPDPDEDEEENDLTEYLRGVTDRQVQGVYDREVEGRRRSGALQAVAEAERREIDLIRRRGY